MRAVKEGWNPSASAIVVRHPHPFWIHHGAVQDRAILLESGGIANHFSPAYAYASWGLQDGSPNHRMIFPFDPDFISISTGYSYTPYGDECFFLGTL